MTVTESRPRSINAPPPDTPMQRRLKLAVMIMILGPMVLFGLYHSTLWIYKMSQGQAVGYEQRDHRIGTVED